MVGNVDTLRNPAGPLPASIYWRRRIVILGVVLAVVAGTVWACTRNSGAEQKPAGAVSTPSDLPTVPADTSTPSASTTATPSASGSASGSATTTPSASDSKSGEASPKASKKDGKTLCAADDLRVSVRTDQKFYSPKENPKITVIIVNIRKSTCYVDLGTANASMTIISGKDRVWSNTDCTDRPKEKLRKFASGDVYTSSNTWKRNRSAKGCPDTDNAAKPGYYVIAAEVGKAKPDERPVFVLEKS